MRFYTGAHKALWEASKKSATGMQQHLYLVAEVDNNHDINAVMLHNGKQKLGSVTSIQAAAIKQLLQGMRDKAGNDQVVVCFVDRIYESVEDFAYRGSITIHGKYSVNERLARKFALN